jgi:dimethylaniline monooxygenase (N-oxide forming)
LTERLDWTDLSYPLFSRLGTVLITCWAQPNTIARHIHKIKQLINFFWVLVSWLLRLQVTRYVRKQSVSEEIQNRVQETFPDEPIFIDRPCVIPFNPKAYYDFIMKGRVLPKRGEFKEFYSDGIILRSGERVPCDVAVLSLGIQTPDFRFLPTKYRYLMEKEGGAQLYRHTIHPRIPRMSFIGLNQSFLFMPTVELSMLWSIAVWTKELQLPCPEVLPWPPSPLLKKYMFPLYYSALLFVFLNSVLVLVCVCVFLGR